MNPPHDVVLGDFGGQDGHGATFVVCADGRVFVGGYVVEHWQLRLLAQMAKTAAEILEGRVRIRPWPSKPLPEDPYRKQEPT